jgi:hypothetical protein
MSLPLPGPIARRAAADALANVGVTEQGGNNKGKYVEIYLDSVGLDPGNPWCAAMIRYRFEAAAAALGLTLPRAFPDSGWCPDYSNWARERGLWLPISSDESRDELAAGDLCLFWFASKKRHAHIGIVTDPEPWGAWTVEGNTSAETGTGVNRDGDGVYKKRRDWSEFGAMGGFVRCPF